MPRIVLNILAEYNWLQAHRIIQLDPLKSISCNVGFQSLDAAAGKMQGSRQAGKQMAAPAE